MMTLKKVISKYSFLPVLALGVSTASFAIDSGVVAAIEASHAAVAEARAQERVAIAQARLHAIEQAVANGVPVPFFFHAHRGWHRRFLRFELFRPVGFGVRFGGFHHGRF